MPTTCRGKAYATLVDHLCKRRALPVALSRRPAGRAKPYVYAHPRPSDVVGDQDEVYVLRNSRSTIETSPDTSDDDDDDDDEGLGSPGLVERLRAASADRSPVPAAGAA